MIKIHTMAIALSAMFAVSAYSADSVVKTREEALKAFNMPTVTGNETWQPKREGSKKISHNARIVSYCDKWTRHEFGGHSGVHCRFKDGNSYYPFELSAEGKTREGIYTFSHDVDVDGDGKTKDDYVMSNRFSLKDTLNLEDWPRGPFFPNGNSGKFYGGMSWYVSDYSKKGLGKCIQEMGVNPDHSTPFRDSRAEDHPLNGTADEKVGTSKLQMANAFIWKKEDFMADGDKSVVTFDENSVLASMVTRTYWFGFDDTRMIVQDGEQLYVSDGKHHNIPKKAFRVSKQGGRQFVCSPTKVTWAKWNPDEIDFLVREEKLDFKKHDFKDVQAVGWYIGKAGLEGKLAHIKWYGFECDAVLTRKDYPSQNMEMVKVKSKGKVPSFNMATCEMPYLLLKKINRWGDVPFHTLQQRYVYLKRGDMGSVRKTFGKHSQNEPATDLSFYDMLAYANTLSEMEGKEPCYYLNPEHTEVFRNQQYSRGIEGAGFIKRITESGKFIKVLDDPIIYVKWGANGHRLATASEWKVAVGESPRGCPPETGTQPVGSGNANANGIYDMNGNVWETVWTYGDSYDPAKDRRMTVLGGDFLSPDSPEKHTASPYGDTPLTGAYNIGLRLVCRDAGLAAPEMDALRSKDIAIWEIDTTKPVGGNINQKAPQGIVETVPIPKGEFEYKKISGIQVNAMNMAKTETTFKQWEIVKQWAVAHGYTFSMSGDLGSSFYFAYEHTADEPVTSIPWNDLLVWCNALSEMEGREACYYLDDTFTKIYKNAAFYRPIKADGTEYVRPNPTYPEKSKVLTGGHADYNGQPYVFVRYSSNGYRLPTDPEYVYAATEGGKRSKLWEGKGNPMRGGEGYKEFGWGFGNAGGRTHPVAQKKPNAFGLYDIVGNVYEYSFSKTNKDKSIDLELDKNNPKYNPFNYYKKSEKEYMAAGYARAFGSSWLWGCLYSDGSIEEVLHSAFNHYYSDVGFRVLRCDKIVKMTIDGKEYIVEGPAKDRVAAANGREISIEGEMDGNKIIVTEVK